MKVLAIDTAGPVVGIAYVDDYQKYMWSHRISQGADSALLEKMEYLQQRYAPNCVAVTNGPGSFTSVRVGVSIALGFAMARGIPVIAISSLEARAAMTMETHCLALLDARKDRVYGQWFNTSGEIPEAISEAQDVPVDDLLELPVGVAVGEGALVYRANLEKYGIVIPSDADKSPALALARLARTGKYPSLAVHQVQIEYIRDASVQPPQNLGVAIGVPSMDVPQK